MIPTTLASNSWNSSPPQSPVVPNSQGHIPDRINDLSLFSQPISLAPASLFSDVRGRRLLLSAARQSPESRQTPPIHRRRNHRLRLRPRRPHRLFRLSQTENQSLRSRARRHLASGSQRQAPPSPRRPKIHARHAALQLPH